MIKTVVSLLLISQYLAMSKQQTISIFSKKYEKEFNIKISPFKWLPCGHTDTLKLEEINMKTITNNLIQCNHIRHISFRKNSLKDIPSIILDNLPALICLDVSENEFNLNNNNFMQHDNLRVLDASYQNSVFINGESNFKIFNTNRIYMPNLEHLFLSGNDKLLLLDTFSLSFPKLLYIYLDNINITNIQTNFFNIMPKTLRGLHLENNKLSNFTVQNMTDIIELYLDGNPLKNIEIVSKKLNILSLSYSATMATIYLYTPYLEYLDLSHNNFYTLPDIQHYEVQSLRTLLLDYNEFSDFPLFVYNFPLTKLSLSYNKLTYITSKHFKYLTSLKMLSLRGNSIRNLEYDAFKDLNHLEFLDLSQNVLKHLPVNWDLSLSNLQFFNISLNYFATISDISIGSYNLLAHMFVTHNIFTSITLEELTTLPNSLTVYLG